MHGEAGEGGGRAMGARGDGGKGEEEKFMKEEWGEKFLKEADVSLAMSSRVAKRLVLLLWLLLSDIYECKHCHHSYYPHPHDKSKNGLIGAARGQLRPSSWGRA